MKKLIAVFAFTLLCTGVKAQPQGWVNVFDPEVAIKNLRPYYYSGTGAPTPEIRKMQKDVSDAVVILAIPAAEGGLESALGTGTFLMTDPSKPYIVILTAGHNVMSANGTAPQTVIISEIGLSYRRKASENWGDGFNLNIEYYGVGEVLCRVLYASYKTDAQGVLTSDCAMIAYPKSVLHAGKSIYKAPYSFPGTITIPFTFNTELFSIHHGLNQAQRLSELTSAFDDMFKKIHSVTPTPNAPDILRIGYWTNGSIQEGSSGAALISPTNGQPTVVGVVRGGYSDNRKLFNPSQITPALETKLNADDGYWLHQVHKLSAFATQIRLATGENDADAMTGERVTPAAAVDLPASQTIRTQSALIGYSVKDGSIYSYTHVGDVTMNAPLANIIANMHVERGTITWGKGYKAEMKDGAAVYAGAITSTAAAAAAAFASPSTAMRETETEEDGITEKVKQSFKVFPSLTKGILNVSPGSYKEAYTMRIIDMNGNELYKESSATSGNRQMDLSSKLKTCGMYLVQIFPAGEQIPLIWKIELLNKNF